MAQPPPAPPSPPPPKWKWHEYHPPRKATTDGENWYQYFKKGWESSRSIFEKVTTYGAASVPPPFYIVPLEEPEWHFQLFRYSNGVPVAIEEKTTPMRSRL